MNHPAPSIAAALHQAPRTDSSIGKLLLDSGKISAENAERVLRMQKELGIRFGEAAVRLGLVSDADIQHVLARQFDYPYLQAGEGKYSERLVAAYQPFTQQVEALRAVRSQLMLRWFARGRKSLVVLGVDGGNGASLFTANLAVVFSQLGERTLLVDANLRTPAQTDIFGLAARQGLSDMLAGRADNSVVTRIPEFVALSVLGSGTLPPNPQELLNRQGFAALNANLEQQHDVVLYDVPAYTSGSDALAVAQRAGGVLLVARRNETLVADIEALTEQVVGCGAEVVGAVMVDF